jgi:hypothetical protein
MREGEEEGGEIVSPHQHLHTLIKTSVGWFFTFMKNL